MPRVKGGTTTRARRKKIMKLAKGYTGSRRTLYRTAHEQVMKSLAYAYRDRKQNKRNFRKLWISRINAAAVANGLKYSKLIHGLSLAQVEVNRKVLADLAVFEPKAFTAYVEIAKKALENPSSVKPVETKAEVKAADKKQVKVEAKVEKKIEPKKEKPKAAPQVVKAAVPVTKEEVEAAELGLSSILATALRQTALSEDIEDARTLVKADLIKALAKLGYQPAMGEVPLEDLLFNELKELAAESNLKNYSKLKKAELVVALKKHLKK